MQYSSSFKIKVLKECILKENSVNDICKQFEIDLDLLHKWKKELLEAVPEIFSEDEIEQKYQVNEGINSLRKMIKLKDKIILKLEKDNSELKKILCKVEQSENY